MKDTKTVWHSFIPWQYDRETAELDDMSAKGWQLQSLGRHKRTYVRDDSLRYRYALDLQKDDLRPDYFDLFREQGWEQMCACRNSDGSGAEGWWYVFRKRYDPALPEEEYRIYTDRPSLEEMKGRWSAYTWSWVALLAVWGAIFVLQPSMSRFLLILWWLAMLLLWTARRRSLRQAGRGTPRRRRRVMPDIAISVLFLAVYAAVTYLSFRTGETFGYDGPASDVPPAMELTIKVPDWYTLTAFAYDGGGEAAGEFTLTDSRDRAVAGGTLAEDRPLRENEHELFLWPGHYTLITDAGAPEGADGGSMIYSLSSGWQHSLFRRK